MDVPITFTVNGTKQRVVTDPQRPLLDVLREDLQLTGTKYGCGEGQCGACAVILDGERVCSCTTPVGVADEKSVTTIEGLARGDALHPVQEAFLAEDAFQCGYCTPGMIITAAALLEESPDPTDEEILERMEHSICRCCGYPRILKAVRRAAASGASRGGKERES